MIMPHPSWPTAKAGFLAACGVVVLVVSQVSLADEDTRLRLEQGVDYRAQQHERRLLEAESPQQRPILRIAEPREGVSYSLDELGQALYLSIQQRQWPAVLYFLNEYLALPGHDPMLVAYSRGALARWRGDLASAEGHYRELLALQSDFLLGRLELARVLFESRQDGEASELFQQIDQGLDPVDIRTRGVGKTVATYVQALEHRQAWQGSVALGPIWNDNLNQSSESVSCLWLEDDRCLLSRTLPKAIAADGLEYELALSRRLPVSGHHGVSMRALAYGQQYKDYGQYNQGVAMASVGYSYQDARNQYSLSPLFEYARQGHQDLYWAWGGKAEWLHDWTQNLGLKLEAESKKLRYRPRPYARLDGYSHSLLVTMWHSMADGQWTLFGGFDWLDRDAQSDTDAYRQGGVRLGLVRQFEAGFSATLTASYRHREYDAYSALFLAKRRDDEQNYNLILRAPRFALYGIMPSLALRHYRVRSNIDWLYSYDRNTVSLRFERPF